MSISGIDVIAYKDLSNEYDLNVNTSDINTAHIQNLFVTNMFSENEITPIQSTTIQAPLFIGDLQGNATSASHSNHTTLADIAIIFTGSLNGDITGTMTNTQIASGVIVNADINSSAAIIDTKLATITTSGKVANSATTATASNNDGTIVLRNNSTGTVMELTNFDGNVYLRRAGSSDNYRVVSIDGGNSLGYLFANFQALGEGIHMSYNYVYPSQSTTPFINNTGLGTSMISTTNGFVRIYTGGTTISEKLRIGTHIVAINSAQFQGDLVGNVTGNVSGSSSTFTGSLSGDITGPMNSTQIASGVIVNSDINASAAIIDTKLATISTSGKVSNSATTATASNTNSTIVLRDNTSGTNIGAVNLQGNLYLQRYPSGTDYRVLTMDTGNSKSYIFANYQTLGDCFNLSYNWFYDTASTNPTYNNPGQGVSRISLANNSLSCYTATSGSIAPIERLRINNDINSINGARFIGNLVGNVTGDITAISISTNQITSTNTEIDVYRNYNMHNLALFNVSQITGASIGPLNIIPNAAYNYVYLNTAGLVGAYITTPTINTLSSSDLTLNPAGSNINCSNKNLTNIKSLTATNPNNFAINILSGVSSQWSALSIGRTAGELFATVVGTAGNWSSSADVGDGIIRLNGCSKKICVNVNNEGSSSLTIKTNGINPTSSTDGTLNVIGGAKINGSLLANEIVSNSLSSPGAAINCNNKILTHVTIASPSISDGIFDAPTLNYPVINSAFLDTPTIVNSTINNPTIDGAILTNAIISGAGNTIITDSLIVLAATRTRSLIVEINAVTGTLLSISNTSIGGINWRLTSQGQSQSDPGNLYLTNNTNGDIYLNFGNNLIKTYQPFNLNYITNQSYAVSSTFSPYTRLVRGIVTSGGAMAWSEDATQSWSSVRNSDGDYTIIFNQLFTDIPCITVTPEVNSDVPLDWDRKCIIRSVGAFNFRVFIVYATYPTGINAKVDCKFHWTAVGK